MENNFFSQVFDKASIARRLKELDNGKVGFYSVGLYPASLAYNCALHTKHNNLLLAPRQGRDLLGAFSEDLLSDLDPDCLEKMRNMSCFAYEGEKINYTLSDLIKICEVVVLSSNSNHIEGDLEEALRLRSILKRDNVLFACLVGSFTYDKCSEEPLLLCQKFSNLAFFSGFHRHGALRNPLDSFTANFCHPDPLNALLGSRLLDKLSPNIQVSAGVHNLEGQYIKAAKNVSSIFAGFAHTFHRDNPGLLPTLLTLLFNQCLDQAAIVSMSRAQENYNSSNASLPLTEIGYGVQRIEAALSKDGALHKVRDHTFTQLTAMVADVKGSMMLPVSGQPTRNFQVGQILAKKISILGRCPCNLGELISWSSSEGLSQGALEGINSLKYWPDIVRKYCITYQDSSMINLLYMSIFANSEIKKDVYKTLTDSRKLTRFCQESVRPDSSFHMRELLNNIDNNEIINYLSESIYNSSFDLQKLENTIYSKNNTLEVNASSDYDGLKKIFYDHFVS